MPIAASSKAIIVSDRVAGVAAGPLADRQRQEGEADAGQPQADQLATPEPVAEVALGRVGEQDDPARDHGGDQGERRERDGRDVERPGERPRRRSRSSTSATRNSSAALRTGLPSRDALGACWAPRCLQSIATLPAAAQPNESAIPISTIWLHRSRRHDA